MLNCVALLSINWEVYNLITLYKQTEKQRKNIIAGMYIIFSYLGFI